MTDDASTQFEESTFRVVGIIDHQDGFNRGILHGIMNFASSQPNWMFQCFPTKISPEKVLQCKPSGVIAHFSVWKGAEKVSRSGVPMVGVLSGTSNTHCVVEFDKAAVGITAAHEFLARGFQNIGLLGIAQTSWSQMREESFCKAIDAVGNRTHVYHVKSAMEHRRVATGIVDMDRNLGKWLQGLPKPVGLFVVNDAWAREVANICLLLKLKIPEEVAILGVDNDQFVCTGTYPQLASIAIPWEKIGQQAASTLDRLMRGENAPMGQILLPSNVVVPRHSLDIAAVADPYLRKALRFIYQEACNPINVADILRNVPVNRRWLERQFQIVLRRSPLEEIHRVRIIKAQQLMLTTDLSISAIAARVGILEKNFAATFGRFTGVKPTQWRGHFRQSGAAQPSREINA